MIRHHIISELLACWSQSDGVVHACSPAGVRALVATLRSCERSLLLHRLLRVTLQHALYAQRYGKLLAASTDAGSPYQHPRFASDARQIFEDAPHADLVGQFRDAVKVLNSVHEYAATSCRTAVELHATDSRPVAKRGLAFLASLPFPSRAWAFT